MAPMTDMEGIAREVIRHAHIRASIRALRMWGLSLAIRIILFTSACALSIYGIFWHDNRALIPAIVLLLISEWPVARWMERCEARSKDLCDRMERCDD